MKTLRKIELLHLLCKYSYTEIEVNETCWDINEVAIHVAHKKLMTDKELEFMRNYLLKAHIDIRYNGVKELEISIEDTWSEMELEDAINIALYCLKNEYALVSTSCF